VQNTDTVYRSPDGRVEVYSRPDGTYGVKTTTKANTFGEVTATIGYLNLDQLTELAEALTKEVAAAEAYYFGIQ
jgi:hypothetical protein